MCMHWMACLCWRDTKSPSVAIGVFALVTSFMQLALSIAQFLSVNSFNGGVPVTTVTNPLYITLACMDFVVVVLSVLLLIGLERTGGCHHWTRFSWVIWMFLYILYESAMSIYFFSFAFNQVILTKEFVIVYIIYLFIKEILLFIGWLFILSHLCYGDSLAVNYSDAPTQVLTEEAIRTTNNYAGFQKPQTYVSNNFDVVRPSSGSKVYSYNCGGCGGGNTAYLGPTRYM